MASSSDLLSLSEAATLLGVHPATLRRWADQGDVLVMVTPGGHRRFPRTEIERLTGLASPTDDDETLASLLVERVLTRTRERLPEQAGAGWMAGLDAGARREKRETGRRLMELLQAALAAEAGELPGLLDDVRDIGQAYTADARRRGLGLTDVLHAVTFFRDQTIDGVLATDAVATDREAGRRAVQRVNAFFNAILLAVAADFA